MSNIGPMGRMSRRQVQVEQRRLMWDVAVHASHIGAKGISVFSKLYDLLRRQTTGGSLIQRK
jgi:hypothetical protein